MQRRESRHQPLSMDQSWDGLKREARQLEALLDHRIQAFGTAPAQPAAAAPGSRVGHRDEGEPRCCGGGGGRQRGALKARFWTPRGRHTLLTHSAAPRWALAAAHAGAGSWLDGSVQMALPASPLLPSPFGLSHHARIELPTRPRSYRGWPGGPLPRRRRGSSRQGDRGGAGAGACGERGRGVEGERAGRAAPRPLLPTAPQPATGPRVPPHAPAPHPTPPIRAPRSSWW